MLSLIAISTILMASTIASPAHPPSRRDIETTGSSYSEQQILEALAGVYSLINTTSAKDGVPVPDAAYGDHPVGLLHYTKSGWMSATITATEPEYRPGNLTFPFQPEDSDADWALVGKHSLGYAGPVTVSDAIPATPSNGQVIHGPLVVANVPSWTNSSQRRNYTIYDTSEGTLLRLDSDRGNGNTGVLWWKRLD